jgi:hypothetical protein
MAARSSVGDIIYRVLLRLYPARFHDEFASDMALDFADASDEAWLRRKWPGLAGVWAGAASDLAASLVSQWIRTRLPLFLLVGFVVALTTGSAALSMAPDGPLFDNVKPHDRELVTLILLTAGVLLIIAATIILSVCFLRPLARRKRLPVTVKPVASLRI